MAHPKRVATNVERITRPLVHRLQFVQQLASRTYITGPIGMKENCITEAKCSSIAQPKQLKCCNNS